ncbi:MAG: hypothetical protein ABI612_09995 [Betaproteobacteria bacterium]
MSTVFTNRRGASGFTLLELAVVVLVITLLLGSLLVPLATQVDQRNIAETQKRLEDIKEALIGFAIANGRFPCPAVSTGAPLESGTESYTGAPGVGFCTNFFDGFVPGTTLGLNNVDSQGFVLDSWGLQQNRIRYAITNATVGGVSYAFTKSGGMHDAGIPQLGATAYLSICASNPVAPTPCGPSTNVLSNGGAVFVVYSLGKNAATTGTATTATADELANLDGDGVFVSKIASNQASAEFDDLVLWISRYSVISRLVASGQLP